jgi:hypothetical protein
MSEKERDTCFRELVVHAGPKKELRQEAVSAGRPGLLEQDQEYVLPVRRDPVACMSALQSVMKEAEWSFLCPDPLQLFARDRCGGGRLHAQVLGRPNDFDFCPESMALRIRVGQMAECDSKLLLELGALCRNLLQVESR